MKKLLALVNQLEVYISSHEKVNPAFSSATIGWQIDHSLLTIDMIIGALQKSNPDKFIAAFNFAKFRVFLFRKIPRGRAKAPKIVMPNNTFDIVSLQNHIAATKEKIELLKNIPSNHFFTHPYFGDLKLKDAITFLEIHTQHHLSIIEDVMKEE